MHLILLRAVNWVNGKQGQSSCEKHLYGSPLLNVVEKREERSQNSLQQSQTQISNYCHQDY